MATRPTKRVKLLDESDSDEVNGGVSLKINDSYARRFEHNKKREEIQRLEEKYGKQSTSEDRAESDSDNSSESEDDEEGELVTAELDAEISATLRAIRSKDPRVYDNATTFYKSSGPEENAAAFKEKEKPMHLRDYHRAMLLNGGAAKVNEDDNLSPKTYIDEQEDLKWNIVREMHESGQNGIDDSTSEDEFLVRKEKQPPPMEVTQAITTVDVENADKDPENFLSNFMAARAWIPTATSQWQPFESDDEEEDARAEAFEAAYNLRFEDPEGANEKIMTHSRTATAKYSVRREELSGRKKIREAEKAKKAAEKQEREEEKARLRKLKIDELQEKVKKIKEAAGLRGKQISADEWEKVLNEDWDDNEWDAQMNARFGDKYYEQNLNSGDEESDSKSKRKRKLKKPTWDDDIDIKDLVPEFAAEEDNSKPRFTLTDSENENDDINGEVVSDDSELESPVRNDLSTRKARLQVRAEVKRDARRERRIIESLVDRDLITSLPDKKPSGFRYRQTSPTTFGLTSLDILLADDSQLNQYAGLKKMATFRDPEKKKKDRKKLGKKARLREWRKETFGDANGPREEVFSSKILGSTEEKGEEIDVDIREHKGKKRKRSRKKNQKVTV
ncbi:Krr1-domain-containing protein [Patellaria atrata CBS 101060]|uniref:Krr1-domain-containing protein n=1 Tax=Patellaria atrata CBS 101060 TaxID=1346257 RepID=A0A9P4VPX5_9PEZI|nr:Krr1-domain-containing protein [Patellaria atrata CBS 101060]